MIRKILLISVLFLSGCAASGPLFSEVVPAEGKGVLYVYRSNAMVNCCVSPVIYINGAESGSLKNGGYIPVVLDPGTYEVAAENTSVGFNKVSTKVEIVAGKSHYVKWYIGDLVEIDFLAYASKYEYHLFPVDRGLAKNEISGLKLSDS
ncbi:MAG: DUF2846 domain-containing protein [Pseudomonadota bacterium]